MKEAFDGIALGLAALGLSLAACGGSNQEQDTTPAAAAAPAPAPAAAAAPAPAPAGPPHLKFAEMTLSEGANAIFKIHADGKTEMAGAAGAWSEGPAVAPDGTIAFKGQQVAKVDADGTVKSLRNGEVLAVKVGTDSITAPNGKGGELVLQIKEDGSIPVAGAPPEKQLKVDGATDAETRRTAIALLGAIFLSGKGKASSEPPKPAEPAPPK